MQDTYASRFSKYFDRDVAQKAARSLSNGAEIEFHIHPTQEVFTFTKEKGKNTILERPASDPQLVFQVTAAAADAILSDESEDIGEIGVKIMKLVVSQDPDKKVSLQLKAGFLSLFSKGYFGIVTSGGSAFASFLASRGLNGMGAIKAAIKKLSQG
jgi:hypothetical protein